MLLISANLVQLFGPDKTPRGWVRWAWLSEELSSTVVACAMTVLPEPEVFLLTIRSCPDNLFVLQYDNTAAPLKSFLNDKLSFQRARLRLLFAPAMDLEMISPSIDTMETLQRQILADPDRVAVQVIEPHLILWFWDRIYAQFGVDVEDWSTTTLHTSEHQDSAWQYAIHSWKTLTSLHTWNTPKNKNTVLFTCFEGHAVDYNVFVDYVTRVNEVLRALLNNQLQLPQSSWFPTLMCPERSCCQYVTPAFIIRRAVQQNLPLPAVVETDNLFKTLRHTAS